MKVQERLLGTIGQCIYCGTTSSRLSKEDIVPLGLEGEWVLGKASCPHCQNITSGIERDVLRHALLPVRAKMNLPTRHKGKRPNEFPMTIEKEGRQLTVNIPIKKRPTVLILPRFKPPAYVDKRHYEKGIVLNGVYYILLGQSNDVGKWVGCSGESPAATSNLHEIKLSIVNGDIYVNIRLFALLPGLGPEYLVVVGKAPSS